ncbi:MAG TPA: GNAT family N-acetyltransferase [Actinomycetes bacterium]|nr:GNAT family N-acetyltransferase [Actinomycetes bacterium]
MPTVAVVPLDLADPVTAELVVRIQRRSYAVEAALIGFDGIPPLRETVAELQASGLCVLGARADGELAGLLGYRWMGEPGGELDIDRLAIDPRFFRFGLASALLDALPPASAVIVSTGTQNEPALALYRRRGFQPTGSREIAPGVTVTDLRRTAPVG